MTSPAITIDADATVAGAARVLSQHNVKRLPVTDTDGKLVGIVSRKDTHLPDPMTIDITHEPHVG